MKAPSRLAITAAVVALLGVGYWLIRPGAKNAAPSPAQAAGPSDSTELRRARHDLSGLAKAFSAVAARTIGLVMVSGQVVDRSSGFAIPGAEVVFSGPAGESTVPCDSEGRYSVEIEPGFYRSYARAEGFVAVAPAAAERLPGPVSAAQVALPQEGLAPLAGLFRDQVGVNLTLSAASVLRGQVVDVEGRAISGAIVAGKGQGMLRVISGSDVSESDGSGRYELVLPSGSIEMEARHDDYAGLASGGGVYLQPGEEREGHTLIMSAGCIIEGWVVDAEGQRIDEGAFELQVAGDRYTPIGEIEAGRVRYASPGAGSVVLRAWPWQHPPSSSKEFRCSEGDHYRDERFVVPDASPALSGYVEDDDGQPVAFAFVDLFSLEPGGATQQERADASGAFAFFELPPGPYQVSVYVAGRGTAMEILDVPSSGVPIRLGGTGTLIGSVKGVELGSMTMTYRCAFRLDEAESARHDAISMPMQELLVPLDRGRFQVDDLPACPLQGSVSIGPLFESFSVEIERRKESLLRVGE